MSFHLGTFLLALSLLFSVPASAKSVHGVFKVVKGDVQVTNKKGKVRKARVGMKVLPKDKIKAAADSRAKIVMVDKNEINITPDTEMLIADYEYSPNAGKKKVMLNVIYGKIRAKVKQKYKGASKFQVKTPSAVAGVRGTDFFTSFNPSSQATKVVTFEGSVEFGVPGANGEILNSVRVDVGQASSQLAGAAPTQPIRLPKNELKAFDAGSDANLEVNLPEDQARTEKPQNQKRQNARGPRGAGPGGPSVAGDIEVEDVGTELDGPNKGPGLEKRQPANAAGPMPGSMLRPEDMIAGPDSSGFEGGIALPPGMGPVPGGPDAFLPPPGGFIPECDFCRDVIEDGTRSLILNVQHQ